MGRLAAGLSEHEEESQAQNKVVIGLLLLMLIYPAAFCALWAILSFTSHGALVAGLTVWAFAYYHTRLVNGGSITRLVSVVYDVDCVLMRAVTDNYLQWVFFIHARCSCSSRVASATDAHWTLLSKFQTCHRSVACPRRRVGPHTLGPLPRRALPIHHAPHST